MKTCVMMSHVSLSILIALLHLHFRYFYISDRELLASKDRLQLEVASHRSTTLELRTHIDVLSDALTTTRSTTKKYEEEVHVL